MERGTSQTRSKRKESDRLREQSEAEREGFGEDTPPDSDTEGANSWPGEQSEGTDVYKPASPADHRCQWYRQQRPGHGLLLTPTEQPTGTAYPSSNSGHSS